MSVLTNLGKVGLNPKGKYSPSETYNRLDFVLDGGSSYVCLETVTGESPSESDKWQALAVGSDGGSIIFDKETIAKAGGVTSINNTNPVDGNVTISAESLNTIPKTRTINNKSLEEDITITCEDIQAVPAARTINGHDLSSDVVLTAEDLHITPSTDGGSGTVNSVNNQTPDDSGNVTLTVEDINAVPANRKINGHELSSDINLTAEDVKAKSVDYEPDLSDYVQKTIKINSKPLDADITLTANDVNALGSEDIIELANGGTGASTAKQALTNLGAVPATRQINGKQLTDDIILTAADLNATTAQTGQKISFRAGTSYDKAYLDVYIDGSMIGTIYFTND